MEKSGFPLELSIGFDNVSNSGGLVALESLPCSF
jgi:hypothetical protein